MSSTEIFLKLIRNDNCPFYKIGNEFILSGQAGEKENAFTVNSVVGFPPNDEICRILAADITRILIQYENSDKIQATEISCGGCSGSIQLQLTEETSHGAAASPDDPSGDIARSVELLSNFSMFQSLDKNDLREIVPLLKQKKYLTGAVILKKGEPAKDLHIIISGTVEVLDEKGGCLSTLKKGGLFGEMSLISGEAVGATIKVAQNTVVVIIKGQDFRKILIKFPSVQMYLTRLLAGRLAQSNDHRTEEVTSGMTGQLAEMQPPELLQYFHLSQKTGVLKLTLPKGSAELHLRDGDLIRASYNGKTDREAVLAILQENQGRFNFDPHLPAAYQDAPAIGTLMEMLLNTSRIIDEGDV